MRLRELFEDAEKTAVIAFGRLNPPTIGHAKLVDKITSIPGSHYLFLSHTQKPKTDPLDFQTKQKFAQQFFPDIKVGNPNVRTPVLALEYLQGQGYTDVIFVAGSDRVESFQKLFDTYNGQPDKTGKIPFKFNSIRVISAGERDPDADDVSGMSASKMRAAAASGDLETFAQGVPDKRLARNLYNAVRLGMGVRESNYDHIPLIDSDELHADQLSEMLNENKSFLIDNEEFQNFQNLVNKFKKMPVVGKNYIYYSIFYIPITKFIRIKSFDQPYKLINYQDNSFVFDVNGTAKKYPENNKESGDLLKISLLFNNENEQSKFEMMMNLKFSNWSIRKALIENKKIKENQTITPQILQKLEYYIDQLFSRVGIDVEFTRHFLDRVNDPRNGEPITVPELANLFKKAYSKWGKKIAQLGPDAQAVITDMSSDINMPFVLNWNRGDQELELVAKTIMRKKNFSTPNPRLTVEEPRYTAKEWAIISGGHQLEEQPKPKLFDFGKY